jgi:hypothetical protein
MKRPHRLAALDHKQPPSFVTGAAELASIADAMARGLDLTVVQKSRITEKPTP